MISIKFQPTPFRFLLYTEWVLLASCGSLAIVEAFQKDAIPVQHFLILLALWGMGLRLPIGSRLIKLFYTAVEIGLIFCGAMMGYLHILPMLYLIVMVRSCFLFNPQGRWAIASVILFLFLLHQISYIQNIIQIVPFNYQQRFWMHPITETLMFSLGLFLVLKLANALLSEQEAQKELTIAYKQVHQYAQQERELATAQERNRIARNLHDSLGYILTALNAQLQAAVELWKQDRASERIEPFLEESQQLGITAMREVRQSVSLLREEELSDTSLANVIADLVATFQEGTGIPTQLRVEFNSPVADSINYVLHRVVQEALTNIYKHAQAMAVEVELTSHAGMVQVKVIDDGCGFHQNGYSKSSFGLKGMKERVAALGGKLEVVTEPKKGCRVVVEVPL
jgi:signal transduction histidine kinase